MTLATVHKALKDKKTSLNDCLDMLREIAGAEVVKQPGFCRLRCGRGHCPLANKKKQTARCKHKDPPTITELLDELSKGNIDPSFDYQKWLKMWRRRLKYG